MYVCLYVPANECIIQTNANIYMIYIKGVSTNTVVFA